jgi:hypothetical protein
MGDAADRFSPRPGLSALAVAEAAALINRTRAEDSMAGSGKGETAPCQTPAATVLAAAVR